MDWMRSKPFIGVVHLLPLPGSARGTGIERCVERARTDAAALADGGADAVLVENFHDVPFSRGPVGAHTVAAMTRCVQAVRETVGLPVGVNVLRNDVLSAIAIAHACGARFVRCNVWVGAAVTDQGLIQGAAHEAIAYRRRLGADVAVLADVGVKHATQLGASPLDRQALDAVHRGLADALIVTGGATGSATPLEALRAAKRAVPDVVVLAGSGVRPDTAAETLAAADGAIVGSVLHSGGNLQAPIDPAAVAEVARAFARARPV